MSPLNDDIRKKYGIKDTVQGVAVAAVDPGSPASDKSVSPGDVLVEVNQQKVASPQDIADQVKSAKDAGRHSVLLLVANPKGDVRFVAIGVD